MSRRIAWVWAALGLLLGGCETGTPPDAPSDIAFITRTQAVAMGRTSDPYTIDSSKVAGDSLIVWVEYGGGCADHVFTPYCSDYVLESHPPQVDFWMHHESHDDPCYAIIHERLAFAVGTVQAKVDPRVVFRVGHPFDK